MTSKTGPSAPCLRKWRLALLGLPVMVGGCAAGTTASLSQAPIFLSKTSNAKGEIVAEGTVNPASPSAATAASPVTSGGNAVLPFGDALVTSDVAGNAASAPGAVALAAIALNAGLPATPAGATVSAAIALPSATGIGQAAGGKSSSAVGIQTAIASNQSPTASASIAAHSPIAQPTSALATTLPPVAVSLPGVSVSATTTLATTGQVLGQTPVRQAGAVASPANALITTTAVNVGRMCQTMKECH